MKHQLRFLLFTGLAALPAAVHAQNLPVAQDSYVVPSTAINYGASGTINVGSASGNLGLVQFDLSAFSQSGSIGKATLVLFVNKLSAAGTINVAEATNVAWTESTVTGLNAPSAGTSIATGVPVATGSSYISVDVTQAVKDWLGGAAANNGLVITGSGSLNVAFDSKESTTTSHPATLTILLNGVGGYGYIYNLSPQIIPIEGDISFDSTGPLSGLIHSTPFTLTILNAGLYSVSFSVSGVESNQFTLFNNGAAVPGTTYGSGAGTQQNTGQAIIAFSAGDIVTLRNHTSAAAVSLQPLAGGTQFNVNASLLILKLQ